MAYSNRGEELGGVPYQSQMPAPDPQGVYTADDYGQPLGPPPNYKEEVHTPYSSGRPKWWDFKAWGWKKWAIFGVILVILIVVIIVAAVLGTKEEKYPSYSKLNYRLTDTCA